MCAFGGGNSPEVEETVKYSQQKTPNRQDTGDAQERAEVNRRRATSTLLTRNYVPPVDETGKKTLLGA